MSRYIRSTWKVTWDPSGTPLVLLDFGDDTTAELAIPWRQEIERFALIGADWGAFYARGNIAREVRVTKVAAYTDPASLREAILAMDAALSARAGEHAPLRIAVQDGDTYVAVRAAIAAHEPAIAQEGFRVAHTFTVALDGLGTAAFSSGFSSGFGFGF